MLYYDTPLLYQACTSIKHKRYLYHNRYRVIKHYHYLMIRCNFYIGLLNVPLQSVTFMLSLVYIIYRIGGADFLPLLYEKKSEKVIDN